MSDAISDADWLRKLRDGGCFKQRCVTCHIRCKEIADRLEALAVEKEILDKRNFLLGLENAKLREALVNIRDNYECDEDAHKYGTICRECSAREALRKG